MGTSPLADLQARLPELMPRDRRRLQRRIDGARKLRNPQALQPVADQIASEIAAAEQRLAQRRAAVPAVSYPAELPVSQKKDDILAAIRDHQVVIVAGETGSGKTTQLPKICLELGRGITGLIGHTQPRRIAARTVADRIAEELDTPLGSAVGYKVRFTDQVSNDTLVKVMTDGILLAEMVQDRQLHQYDTIIIDEAHERSLNIDFLLGYLKQLLPRRPDLKIIITSATIDPERFSRHLDGAPIIEVSGRTYPVEVRYRPIVDPDSEDEDRDQTTAICDAVDELSHEPPGDVLVFLSGEREIRDTADALQKLNLRNTEILPLYARLSTAEQHRVFQPHAGRRIVLATNVAETSLTVPGIKYVVDPGTARISRYSHRTKVQRLPIEAVSQASANQRKGRCGRTSDGICIRLYTEADFLSRPEFTDPEVLRTNLASVILQMTSLSLGDIANFPFIDGPDRRNIADGVQLLQELGALDAGKLTPLGRQLAQLPVDPRMARMVLEADRNGCVAELMVITAALSIQDPRERPVDKQQAATEKHARFADKDSDFVAYLSLWNYLREQQKALSGNQFRRLCKAEFLHYLRIREWQDIHSQLRQVVRTLGLSVNTEPADPQRVHVSLLAGLLSHIGLKEGDRNEYLGARGAKFAVFPGSALFKKPPRWVMAAELVETSRLWGRMAARIEPEWVEPLAGHLLKRSYSEPHWEKTRGAVMAFERVTLYGVPLVASRKVNYGRVDPEMSRELFIRHALVEGDWSTHHKFFHANRELLEDVEELEHRARRRDIVVDDETLFDFYDQRIPADVVSGRHFDSWWKKTRRDKPELLTFNESMLVTEAAADIRARDYPDEWRQGELTLPLSYQFEPGSQADGVTVDIPLPLLNQASADGFDWLIPGLREELVTALIRSLPKPIRRNFVPVADHAKAVLPRLDTERPLLDSLADELRALRGVVIRREDWGIDRLPDHLRVTYRVVNEQGRTVAEGKDLDALKQKLRPKTRTALAKATPGVEKRGLRTWDFGVLARTVEHERAGHVVKAYPALVDEGDSVAIRVFDTEADQQAAMRAGTRRLLLLNVASPVKFIHSRLTNRAKLAFSHNPHGSVTALFDDCIGAAVDKLVADAGGPAWDGDAFATLLAAVREGLNETALDVVNRAERVLSAAHAVEQQFRAVLSKTLAPSLADIRAQLNGLIYPGFVTATGWRRLPDLARYLQGIERRLDKLPQDPHRDRLNTVSVQQVQDEYRKLVAEAPPSLELAEIRWMIEELRISLFAQTIGTAHPVSEKRIYRAMDAVPL